MTALLYRFCRSFAAVVLVLASFQAVAPVFAQTVVEEPLCGSLGQPASAEDLRALSGATVRLHNDEGLLFREVIADLSSGEARSTRFPEIGRPTAQNVSVRGRNLCLDLGGSERSCLLVLHCQSENRDFAVVDDSGEIVGLLNTAVVEVRVNPPPDSLPQDHDWVPFARGTFSVAVTPTSTPVAGGQNMLPVINQNCQIGGGHPDFDGALAFTWDGSCQNSRASWMGRVVVLRPDGTLFSVGIEGSLRFEEGELRLQYQEHSLAGVVDCIAEDGSIPRSRRDVARIEMLVQFPLGAVQNAGDPVVLDGIYNRALPFVEQICGVTNPGVPLRLQLVALSRGERLGGFVSIIFDPQGRRDIDATDYSSINLAARRLEVGQVVPGVMRQVFLRHLESEALGTWRTSILSSIESGPLNSIAEALQVDHLRTLLALVEGRRIPVLWDAPDFADGVFIARTSFNTASDPVDIYLRGRQGAGWAAWRPEMRVVLPPSRNVVVICRVPPASARRLTPGRVHMVNARLVAFNGRELVVDCTVP